jgi:hypothetical protein
LATIFPARIPMRPFITDRLEALSNVFYSSPTGHYLYLKLSCPPRGPVQVAQLFITTKIRCGIAALPRAGSIAQLSRKTSATRSSFMTKNLDAMMTSSHI